MVFETHQQDHEEAWTLIGDIFGLECLGCSDKSILMEQPFKLTKNDHSKSYFSDKILPYVDDLPF